MKDPLRVHKFKSFKTTGGREFFDIKMFDGNFPAEDNVYFAHPINMYNIELERRALGEIAGAFPHYQIINPNDEAHENGYKLYKRVAGNGMKYYFDNVIPFVKYLVATPLADGMYTSGVAGEVEHFLDLPSKEPELFKDERRLFRWTKDGGLEEMLNFPEDKVLSIEETRERLVSPYHNNQISLFKGYEFEKRK